MKKLPNCEIKETKKRKRRIGPIALLVLIALIVGLCVGCSSGKSQEKKAEREENAKILLEGKVEVPDTFGKSKELVEAELNSIGINVNFVVSNFDDVAESEGYYLREGECNSIYDSPQVELFSYNDVGVAAGYYADVDCTINVPYSDHDYDGRTSEETDPDVSDAEEDDLATNTPAPINESENGVSESDETKSDATVFSPQDVSDATIKSISTYNDYLTMYKMIIEDYLANYEAVFKGTVLYDETTFQTMKNSYDEAFKQQEAAYGSMGNSKLVGKDTLVEFLIDYRDSLKEYTDIMAEALG